VEAVGIILKNICIVGVYRPPSYPYEQFVSSFTNVLMEIQHLQLPTVIVGDFNVNTLLSSNRKFEKKLNEYGYIQMINEPTTESGTCLDLVFLKGLSDRTTVKLLPTHNSFHEALKYQLKTSRNNRDMKKQHYLLHWIKYIICILRTYIRLDYNCGDDCIIHYY
jgi:hypothetical protein